MGRQTELRCRGRERLKRRGGEAEQGVVTQEMTKRRGDTELGPGQRHAEKNED